VTGASFLDELRTVRKHVLEHEHRELTVPGSGGRIVVRFRPPADRDQLTGVIASYKENGALDSDQERQLFVDCCDEILRRGDDGELGPFDEDGPLRFDGSDSRWGEDVESARECVAKLYNLDKQPLALAGPTGVLIDWLQGIDAEIAARIEKAGKPKGAGEN
jgi:hypothetical protein